jgi:hypothetical protein
MHARNQRDDESDEAHYQDRMGLELSDTCPSPEPASDLQRTSTEGGFIE